MKLRVINPYDQSLVAELPYDSGKRLESKVAAAQDAFERWRRVPLEERVHRVQEGMAYFRKNAEAIAREMTLQMGKPIVQARREVETFFERAEHMIGIAAQALAPDILEPKEGFHRRIEHVPLGVV